MKTFITIVMVFVLVKANAQTFYAVININIGPPYGNLTYELNTNNCDSSKIFTCISSVTQYDYDSLYFDIAIDTSGNIYYVTSTAKLYTRKYSDSNSCQFLGVFNSYNIEALVTDLEGNVLAAGYDTNGIPALFRYDTKAKKFYTIGNFPNNFLPSGDLFFYEGNLFMTAEDLGDAFIVEVVINDPSKSCYYMNLGSINPYSAFSIQYPTYSDAYVISTELNNSSYTGYISKLYKINLQAKTLSDVICEYPFQITGTATVYKYTPEIIDSNSCSSLPIHLLNFTSTLINNSVKLQWQTANEVNSNYFSIERSSDGINFNAIGKEVAAGNSGSVKQYSFIDASSPTLLLAEKGVFYRLKEVDKDGKFTYSNILFVKVPQRSNISVNPNPAMDRIFITSSIPVQKIEIINPQGVVVMVKNDVISSNPIFISNLSKGIYFLKVYTSNEILVKEFVKN